MANDKNLARDKIIRDALSAGKNAKQIDAELRKYGFKEKYNPLLYKGNWENLLPRAGEQFKNMGRDMSTAGGELIYNIGKPFKAAMDAPSGIKMEMFKRSLGDNSKVKDVLEGMAAGYGASKVISKIPGPIGKVGGLGGMVTGGLVGLAGGPEKFTEMLLEPYNMSAKPEIDLAKGLIKTGISKSNIPPQQLIEEYKAKRKDSDIRDVAQGALDNPVYALLDTAGAWAPIAGKSLAKTGRAVQKSKLPNVIKEIALSPEQREFNRELTNAIASGKVKSSDLYKGFNVLDNNLTANRENIAHYIITNQDNGLTKGELNLAKKLKTDLTAAEKKAIKEGYLNADDAKRNVVSQYVMQNILDESNLLQKDIDDILRGQPLRPEAKQMIDVKMANRIRKLVNEGSDLYDSGDIAYLTQKYAAEKDPLGLVSASDINSGAKEYFDTSRVIGRASSKRIGRVLDDSIKFQLDQVGNSTEALEVLNNVLTNEKVASLLTGANKTRDKSKILRKFKDSIAKDIRAGERIDMNKALSASGLDKFIDESYFRAINNALRVPKADKYRRALSSIKKALLTSPHWVILNRIGNLSNNAMSGVQAIDYIQGATKYKKYIPKQLKLQTSFANYVSEGAESVNKGIKSAFTAPINKIKKSLGRFANSEKLSGDYAELAQQLYSGTSDLLAEPIFKLESTLELQDRFANMVRQAKKEAKLRGKGTKVEDILKEADTNQALFNKLNTEVNKSLGDYVGRNYFFNPDAQELISETLPFYRFMFQTGRTTAHQLAHRPLDFANIITNPIKYGNKKSEEIIDEYGLDPKFYKGGVPYAKEADGTTRFMRFEPLPFGAIADQLSSIYEGDLMGAGINPLISAPYQALAFSKYGKPVETPAYHALLDAKNYKEAARYQPTLEDRLRLMGATALENSSGTYRLMHNTAPELAEFVMPRKGLRSTYPTAPFTFNEASYPRTMPSELVGKWFGVQTYPGFEPLPDVYKVKEERKKAKKRTKKINKYKKPVKEL